MMCNFLGGANSCTWVLILVAILLICNCNDDASCNNCC